MTTPIDAALYLAQEAGIPANGATPLTDYGNGERMVAAHGQDLRFVSAWNKWLAWDGRRWKLDSTEEVMRRAKKTVRDLYQEGAELAQQAAAEPDDILRKQLSIVASATQKWARQSESWRSLQAVVAAAKSQPTVSIEPADLDSDPWLFNCLSGVIDLRTGELLSHHRDYLITKLAPTEYDRAAECPQWLAFLDRIMAGNQQLIGYLQRAIGYSLTGITSEHCVFLLYGTGRNGKTTFLNTFLGLMGDYAHQAPPDLLMLRHGETHPTEKAVLHGIRFAPATETQEASRIDEATLKALTGGDMIVARRMREDFWQFTPTHHLWEATNHKPIIRGTDWGIWSRLHLIPFLVIIPLEEQDRLLADRLKTEWPAILAWSVQGCLTWQSDGLMAPLEVRRATAEYRDQMDVLGAFLLDRCEESEGTRSTAKALYDAYQVWAKTSGERVMTKTTFGLTLQERGLHQARGAKGIRMWRGLRLLDENELPDMQGNLFDDPPTVPDLEF